MTHSLHRFGNEESLKNDFVWFVFQSKDQKVENKEEIMEEYFSIIEEIGAINWGDNRIGSILTKDKEELKNELLKKKLIRLRGVFDNKNKVKKFLQYCQEKRLNISVVISGVISEILDVCKELDLKHHSINYSLGVWGAKEKLPDNNILAITSMCGHHMISPSLVRKVIKDLEKKRMTIEEGVKELSRFCPCGIFNQERARELLIKSTEDKKG